MATADDQGLYIGTADVTQPEDDDFINKGAAEVRQAKVQQDNTWTNFTGKAVTATEDELNYMDGVTSNVQTQLDAKVASTDYEDADVLNKVRNVDGSGSGLDADLLDGLEGAAYAKLAGGTFTGQVVVQSPAGGTNPARVDWIQASYWTAAQVAAQGYLTAVPANSVGDSQINFTNRTLVVSYTANNGPNPFTVNGYGLYSVRMTGGFYLPNGPRQYAVYSDSGSFSVMREVDALSNFCGVEVYKLA